ncbi:MAG: hypothetical protein ACW99J_20780 [Candidatus Thorarchaeota archaeon]|jgi:hypothetical protein
MEDRDFAIIEKVNKARLEIQKFVEERLIELEKEILDEMGIPLEEAQKEWQGRNPDG